MKLRGLQNTHTKKKNLKTDKDAQNVITTGKLNFKKFLSLNSVDLMIGDRIVSVPIYGIN